MSIEGNEYWKLRSKHGRDKLFSTPELLWDAACEYFTNTQNTPFKEEHIFSFQGTTNTGKTNKIRPFNYAALCLYLGVGRAYFTDFRRSLADKEDKLSKDFSLVLENIDNTIFSNQYEGAASGFFKENIVSRALGLKDNAEVVNKNIEINSTITKEEIKAINEALDNEY